MRFKKIYIELSDHCGLKCSFCPSKKNQRKQMDQELFSKIAQQIEGKCQRVCLHLLGDPCKIANLKEYLEILKQHHLWVDLVTSGFYLEHQHLLLDPPLHQIAFSLDAGFDKNNPRPKDYLQRILEFCDWKMQSQSKVFINLRIQDSTLQTLPIATIFEFFKQPIPKDFKTYERIRLAPYISLNITKTFQWADKNAKIWQEQKYCHAIKEQFGILSNGIVVPCCMDTQGIIALGDANTQSLDSILTSHRAQNMQKGFKKGVCVEELCKKCLFPTNRTSML